MDIDSNLVFQLIVVLSIFTITTGQDWEQRDDSGYEYLFSSYSSSWFEANGTCTGHNANLASVLGGDEHDWIQRTRSNEDYWIGLRNRNRKSSGDDDNWQWSDGSDRTFEAWDTYVFDEPDDYGDVCAYYSTEGYKNWYDAECQEHKKFICKRNTNDCDEDWCLNHGQCVDQLNDYYCECLNGYTGSVCETDIDVCASNPCENNSTCSEVDGSTFKCDCAHGFIGDRCLAGSWAQRGNSGYEYLFSTEDIGTMNWTDSRAVCLTLGADLVSVHSAGEHEWIKRERESFGYWMGMRNPNAQGVDDDNWAWSDGTPVDFKNWTRRYDLAPEPDYAGDACGRYGYQDHTEDWYDSPCTDYRQRFICKRDINDCVTRPCQYGKCVDGVATFTCQCDAGFTGKLCQNKEAITSNLYVIVGGVIAALILLIIVVIVIIVVRRCRTKSQSKLKKDHNTELGSIGGSGQSARNHSEVITTENDVYEHTPLNSPVRYPVGSVLYTAPGKWGGRHNQPTVQIQDENPNRDSDPLYEKEQPVFNFTGAAMQSERTDSKESLVRDASLYSKEQPVDKPQIPEPDSTYYDVPIPVVKPVTGSQAKVSPPRKDNSLYSKEQPVLQPPLGQEQSMYAREHYRSDSGETCNEPKPSATDGEVVYVNQNDLNGPNNQNDLKEPNNPQSVNDLQGAINTQNDDAYSLSDGLTPEPHDVTSGQDPGVYTYADHNFTPAVFRSASHPSSTLSNQDSMSTGEYSPTYMPMGSPDPASAQKPTNQNTEVEYANYGANDTAM